MSERQTAYIHRMYKDAWPTFAARFNKYLPDLVKRLGSDLMRSSEINRQFVSPLTLVHGDYRLSNLMFHPGETESAPAIIDWEDVYAGPCVSDVAWLLMTGMPIHLRAELPDLVRCYYEHLLKQGISDYAYRDFIQDFRVAAITRFVQVVLLAASSSLTNRERLARQLAQRLAMITVDLSLHNAFLQLR